VGGNPTVYMRVNDETEKTFCSSGCTSGVTFPDETMAPIIHYGTRAASAVRSGDLDYMHLLISGLSRY